MEKSEVKIKMIEILNNLFLNSGVNLDVLEYADLIDYFGMDSITFISLIVEVESRFNITVPDNMLLMDNFKKVDDIVAVVEQELAKGVENSDGCK